MVDLAVHWEGKWVVLGVVLGVVWLDFLELVHPYQKNKNTKKYAFICF